jgi:uroporphyrin-3 C-methyltransferase
MSEQDRPPEPDRPDELAADDAATAPEAADLPEPPRQTALSPARRRLVIVAACVVAFAVLAAVTASVLWRQNSRFGASLAEVQAATSAELQNVRVELGRLNAELNTVDEELLARRTELARVEQRLDTVPGRFTALEQRLESLQGGSVDARAQWLRAEAEYYLALANTELTLAGRWDNASAALQLADDKLRDLANPRFNGVRSAIANELQALAAVRLPDIDGLVFGLGQLAERVDVLPMRAEAPDNFTTGGVNLDNAEPGLSRLWQGLKGALLGIIRVERREDESALQLSLQERALVRRQLVLELELLRYAALRGEVAGFQAGLDAAIGLLRRDFDTSTGAVEGAIALLSEMQAFEIAPPAPDISTSLTALRNTALGGD